MQIVKNHENKLDAELYRAMSIEDRANLIQHITQMFIEAVAMKMTVVITEKVMGGNAITHIFNHIVSTHYDASETAFTVLGENAQVTIDPRQIDYEFTTYLVA